MALFGKSEQAGGKGDKGGKPGNGAKPSGALASGFRRSDRKAEAFFRHAETTADARNYDYAVELYINGLRHQPDNMNRHEELREVAMRRKVAGGKKPGMFGVKSIGSEPVDKMLTAEKSASLDPTNAAYYQECMEAAITADGQEAELNLGEVAYWAGTIAMDMMGSVKKAGPWVKMRDNFRAISQYDKAIECCRRAIAFKPNDSNLLSDLKDLEAEKYAAKSSESAEEGGGSFRANIKDSEEQELQRASGSTTQAGGALERLIAARRADVEENPDDPDLVTKLVDALLKKEEAEPEKEAIQLLQAAAEQTGQYRFKVRAGDVAMRQFNRVIRQLRLKMKRDGVSDELKAKLQQAMAQKLKFELKEYTDRVSHYPTDLALKFELGKRQFLARQFDDAIGSFQQAKDDPKNKAQAHYYLGKAYLQKGWSDEAIETLADGIQLHPSTSDGLAKEMRYDKMITCAEVAEKNENLEMAQEAERLASELLKTDINYKDIREQRDRVRGLVQTFKRD